MSQKNLFATGLVTLSMLAQNVTFAQSNRTVERPPQYVIFAFDGSYTNSVWQYSRDFSKQQKSRGIDTYFTFFINPVYLLTEAPASKSAYKAPGGNRGSAIGWGDNNADVSERVDQMNAAHEEGHELGSHAVGHHNGQNWSLDDWTSEFTQFDHIVRNFFSINGMTQTRKGARGLNFLNDMVGFRAPQLGVNESVYQVLPQFGFKYDTSKVNNVNYWPRKNPQGTWNFPLAQVPEPGGARRWLSMDYNFCVRDSARITSEDPSALGMTAVNPNSGKVIRNGDRTCLNVISANQKAQVKANMMSIYRSYFNTNYYGNRAPLHLGHHFSNWMSGAYMETFYEFANEVCSKPEVKCVTYKEFMAFLESKTPDELAAFQASQFAPLSRPKSAVTARSLDLSVVLSAQGENLKLDLVGADALRPGLKKQIFVNGFTQEVQDSFRLQTLRKVVRPGDSADLRIAVKDRLGKEIATATYKINKVGTAEESVGFENIEEEWLKGHLDGAHKDEALGFTQGN